MELEEWGGGGGARHWLCIEISLLAAIRLFVYPRAILKNCSTWTPRLAVRCDSACRRAAAPGLTPGFLLRPRQRECGHYLGRAKRASLCLRDSASRTQRGKSIATPAAPHLPSLHALP